jgi:hypothetical protein
VTEHPQRAESRRGPRPLCVGRFLIIGRFDRLRHSRGGERQCSSDPQLQLSRSSISDQGL